MFLRNFYDLGGKIHILYLINIYIINIYKIQHVYLIYTYIYCVRIYMCVLKI